MVKRKARRPFVLDGQVGPQDRQLPEPLSSTGKASCLFGRSIQKHVCPLRESRPLVLESAGDNVIAFLLLKRKPKKITLQHQHVSSVPRFVVGI